MMEKVQKRLLTQDKYIKMLTSQDNPYGDYSGRSSYWIRIVAEYPFGDSPLSDEIVPFIPLEQVKSQTDAAYINATDKETGYVTLKWDAVPAVAGYKV